MTRQLTDIFLNRVSSTDLSLPFQLYLDQFSSSQKRHVFLKFFSWCDFKKFHLPEIDEVTLLAYQSDCADNGYTLPSGWLNSVRRLNSTLPQEARLALQSPQEEEGARQQQFKSLSSNLQSQIEELVACCAPGGDKASRAVVRRQLLRALELAEKQGCEIAALDQFWAPETLQIFDKCTYGQPDIKKWQESLSAEKMRYEHLRIGCLFAKKVSKDMSMLARLKSLLVTSGSPKERNLSFEDAAAARELATPEALELLKNTCRTKIEAFCIKPTGRRLPVAQTAANALIQLASGQPRSVVVKSAEFAGVPRLIPGTDRKRPMLILTIPQKFRRRSKKKQPKRIVSVEETVTEETQCCFDQFWLAFLQHFGQPPRFLNERCDFEQVQATGSTRNPETYSTTLRHLGEKIGLHLTPEILKLAVVALLKQAGVSDEDAARSLGIRQMVNFRRSFRDLLDDGTDQLFADGVDSDDD